jgi:hypothetical protein
MLVAMQNPLAHHTLEQFRRAVYQTLGQRKDSLFELMEAAVAAPAPATLARLSLSSLFRRRWPSTSDALAEGTVDVEQCRRLVQTQAIEPAPGGRSCVASGLWVGDGTVWPRPAAVTSPDRTYGHRTAPGTPQSGVVPAWEYEWLVTLPAPGTSWVLPLDVRRRGPRDGTPTAVQIAMLRGALAQRSAGAPGPVVPLDSGERVPPSRYDPVQVARADLACDVLVRLRTNRVFYRAPGPYAGRGAPRKYGAVFKLADATTHGLPDGSAKGGDPGYGQVEVDVWRDLRGRGAADAPFTIVRVQVERLPGRLKPPGPMWLAWVGGELPEDLLLLWSWYCLRFTVEHGFRFLKQDLGWTTVRPQAPAAADRWTWLLALGCWQLWLARPLVADQRLPWEQPRAPGALTPGRVRRGFLGFIGQFGTPARSPKPRGKSPGRQDGERPGPRERHKIARRDPKRAA